MLTRSQGTVPSDCTQKARIEQPTGGGGSTCCGLIVVRTTPRPHAEKRRACIQGVRGSVVGSCQHRPVWPTGEADVWPEPVGRRFEPSNRRTWGFGASSGGLIHEFCVRIDNCCPRLRDLDQLDSVWYTRAGNQVTCPSDVGTIIEARCRIRRNDEAGVQG